MNRREFLALPALMQRPAAKALRGVFPIAQSPFTDSDKLDIETLVAELRFLHKGGVHGCVWPQLASEWWTLTKPERLEGAEALCAEGRKLKPAIVIGVQAEDPALAPEYARHAAAHGADAIIALPPPKQTDPKVILEYYRAIGQATELPLIVQAVGNLSVDDVAAIAAATPTVRAVKDEAGEPLVRISEFRKKAPHLLVFTGNHGRTMIDELMRGFSGTMPAAPFADVYAAAWDLWQAGRQRDALDRFGAAAVLIQEINAYGMESIKYLLELRGVFRNSRVRETRKTPSRFDEEARKNLKSLFDLMKPHLRV